MALAPNASQGRVHLIREMARSRTSNASDSGSDRGSARGFDTESQLLPVLPAATPQNAPRLHSEPDFQINTSALRRAFPDFSQYGSSDDADSLEIGRAASSGRPSGPRRILSSEDPSENISLNIGQERYTVTGTPPTKPRTMKPAGDAWKASFAKRNVSQKENADPNAKQTDFVSSASSRGSQTNRKALGELNASAQSDESLNVTGERPKTVHTQPHSTRFSQPHRSAPHEDTNQFASQTVSQPVEPVSSAAGTYQSFALPDLPNITELVSGQRKDGTPLFSKTSKARSRFATPSSTRRSQPDLPVIDGVPVPADVESLYLALQLLQEKVTTLEEEKRDAMQQADNYELEYLQAKASLEAKQHSDSGVDVDNEEDTRTRDFEAERLRLEASIKSLRSKLDRANKKLSASEIQISELKGDKLAARHQLEEAEANSTVLREEGRDIHDEFEDVKLQLSRVTKQHEKLISKFSRQETELKRKIDRRERAVKEMAFLARELWTTRRALSSNSTAVPPPRERSTSRGQAQRRRSSSGKASDGRVRTQTLQPHVSEPTEATGATTFEIQDPEYTTELDLNVRPSQLFSVELAKDESFMSFMEGDEVAKLRQIVEQDKARVTGAGNPARVVKEDTLSGLLPGPRSAPTVPKSSLKRTSTHSQHADQDASITDFQDTRTSVGSQRSDRRRRSSGPIADEMTSAFILQDITLAGAPLDDQATGRKTINIRRPIPVSDRAVSATDDNPDPTIRPLQSPGLALASVVQGLEEELARLRSQFAQQERLYHQHDPALSKRERKTVYGRMQSLLATIELRCDQIYALYDVLEGQKDAGQCMDESEVEVTLHNLGIQVVRPPVQRKKSSEKLSRRRSNSGASTKQDTKGRRKSVVIDLDNDNVVSDDDLPVGGTDDERFQDEFEGFDTTNTNTQSMRL